MIDTSRIIESKLQHVNLSKKDFEGFILDVGGGGEGIIGQLYGTKAVTIDIREDELEETKNDSLKIVMDACEMSFLDASFSMVLFFYSLMYMDTPSKQKALCEACRVLKPNGIIEIWDSEIPEYDIEKDIFIANVSVDVNGRTIKTGYGTGIENSEQNLDTICHILISLGMEIEKAVQNGSAFHISALKNSVS